MLSLAPPLQASSLPSIPPPSLPSFLPPIHPSIHPPPPPDGPCAQRRATLMTEASDKLRRVDDTQTFTQVPGDAPLAQPRSAPGWLAGRCHRPSSFTSRGADEGPASSLPSQQRLCLRQRPRCPLRFPDPKIRSDSRRSLPVPRVQTIPKLPQLGLSTALPASDQPFPWL